MTVLVFADHDNAELKGATLNTIAAAAQLGNVDIVVAGSGCRVVAEQAATVAGVSRVLLADGAQYTTPLAETIVPLLQSIADGYSCTRLRWIATGGRWSRRGVSYIVPRLPEGPWRRRLPWRPAPRRRGSRILPRRYLRCQAVQRRRLCSTSRPSVRHCHDRQKQEQS